MCLRRVRGQNMLPSFFACYAPLFVSAVFRGTRAFRLAATLKEPRRTEVAVGRRENLALQHGDFRLSYPERRGLGPRARGKGAGLAHMFIQGVMIFWCTWSVHFSLYFFFCSPSRCFFFFGERSNFGERFSKPRVCLCLTFV